MQNMCHKSQYIQLSHLCCRLYDGFVIIFSFPFIHVILLLLLSHLTVVSFLITTNVYTFIMSIQLELEVNASINKSQLTYQGDFDEYYKYYRFKVYLHCRFGNHHVVIDKWESNIMPKKHIIFKKDQITSLSHIFRKAWIRKVN